MTRPGDWRRSARTFRRGLLATATLAVLAAGGVRAEDPAERQPSSPNNPVVTAPAKDGRGPFGPHPHPGPAAFPREFRPIDGAGSASHPDWGATGTVFLRLASSSYDDGVSAPAQAGRPNARGISNAVLAQNGSAPNAAGASDYLWQWGQFVDHDMDLTGIASPLEPFDIAVPPGDPQFDPQGSGTQVIPLDRSAWVEIGGVREQFNLITAFIDASNVYGSDPVRAAALRALDDTGRLRTGAGDLLPFNTAGLPNAPSDDPSFFLAGDVRANEQVGLTAMHTLFVREHNYQADAIRTAQPWLSGEEVYQRARAIVGAELQSITYNEFLPLLLGRNALSRYRGFDGSVDPGIANEFATAAYRVGHTMVSSSLLRLGADGAPIADGPLSLALAFFNPAALSATGIDPVLRGLAAQPAEEMDCHVVDEMRNFLFGPPGGGGLDLASLNIQRGRDHGLAGYNRTRAELGLGRAASFAEISSNPQVQADLAAMYASVDDVDLWVGGLAEDHAGHALVGETFRAILVDQFERVRDGDRFWYESYLPPPLVRYVERECTLARIIRRNTGIGDELPDDVFRVDGGLHGGGHGHGHDDSADRGHDDHGDPRRLGGHGRRQPR